MAYIAPEKHQVSTSEMVVFGIQISSRHGLASEMAEMINFCTLAAHTGIADKVISLFYDSNSNSCTIKATADVTYGDAVDANLLNVGLKTLSQFDWHGGVEHGSPTFG